MAKKVLSSFLCVVTLFLLIGSTLEDSAAALGDAVKYRVQNSRRAMSKCLI